MRGRTAAALAAAGALACAQAGCGGANTLTPRQLHNRATKICYAAQRKMDAIATPTLPSDEAAFLSAGVAVMGPELSELKRLAPPSSAAGEYARARAAMQDQIGVLRSALARLRHGSDPLVEITVVQRRLAPVEARADAAWNALAISACGDR